MSPPQNHRMPDLSPADNMDGALPINRDVPHPVTFTLAVGSSRPTYQATVEDECEIKDEDQQDYTTSTSEHDEPHSESSATCTASDNANHLTSDSPWNNSSDTPSHTEAYPSSPPPMPDLPDDSAFEAGLEAYLQSRMFAIRAIRGPLPTNYQHLDLHSPGYRPAPRFQFKMQPDGYLPLQHIRRDLYILNAIYPEHRSLFVFMLRLFENCDPKDEMVLKSVNALPHLRYLVGLCRTCFLVPGGGRVCCGQVVPE